MHRIKSPTSKTKFPQAYNIERQQAAGRMPVLTRDHLALKLRQNWMAKYPMDTCSNGGSNLDDSLTSLNWLQNLNILKITSPTPPSSPIPPFDSFKNVKVNPNSILNVACGPPPTKFGDMRFPYADTPPPTPTTLGGDSVDYKTNPYVKPPYSYATLICMAMKETKKSKITLSAIYNWITDNFMYYRLADPSWQVRLKVYISFLYSLFIDFIYIYIKHIYGKKIQSKFSPSYIFKYTFLNNMICFSWMRVILTHFHLWEKMDFSSSDVTLTVLCN